MFWWNLNPKTKSCWCLGCSFNIIVLLPITDISVLLVYLSPSVPEAIL